MNQNVKIDLKTQCSENEKREKCYKKIPLFELKVLKKNCVECLEKKKNI